ncbi:MAG TPA: hypothetical protein VE441_02465 [Mycobacterium sp.]|jgi:hypothetical protein|nr:hypothetical protein [Mycobacterium sp.]
MTNTQAFLIGVAVGAATTYYLTSKVQQEHGARPLSEVRKSADKTAAKLRDSRRAMADTLG